MQGTQLTSQSSRQYLSYISMVWRYDTKKEKGTFTGDQVIDAYLKGKRDGLESYQKALLSNLSTNVDKTGEYTLKVFEHLNGFNFEADAAFLKINSWNSFEVIIAVKEETFLNPVFLSIYDFLNAFEEGISTDIYTVTFSFVDYNGSLNEDNLHCDGYILKLKEK